MAWANLPRAMLPLGMSTTHFIPARAAYAAAEAEVLPVDAQMTTLAFFSAALEMAMVMPRSLKDPVGFKPSYFKKTCRPVRLDKSSDGIKGVLPSCSVTTGVFWETGRYSR